MFIGSTSKSTILEVFRTGITELINAVGLPSEVHLKTARCEMHSKATDFSKRVDILRIVFPVKEGTDPAKVSADLQALRIGGHVQIANGTCAVTLPSFEWRQLPKAAQVDSLVEAYCVESLRAQTWEVQVRGYVKQGFNINRMIELMKEERASDLHLRAGSPPYIRVDNDLRPLDLPSITADDMAEIVDQLGGEAEVAKLESERESSFQFHAAGIGYLRCSGYIKQGAMALAVRLIPEDPLPFDQLNIPDVVRAVCNKPRGLFLVCGVTGSGKSTTLAAMVDYINQTRHAHIITIEDPVEYVYRDKKSIVSQRQVGRDTFSFANALRGSLREDPDVILVGEMRDIETIRSGISAAETGHLVFSTLHTMTAVDTVNRVISYFPQAERDLIRQELAYSLQGVVCQRLLKKIGGGRIPALEILLGGKPLVRDAILENDIGRLHSIIEVDSDMMSFDQYAVDLFRKGLVTKEEAMSACSNDEAFERVISGIKSTEGRKLLG
ncbi:MAG: PilT/PilU family type 4a pilus ATPase [Candidatus Hydrogenedentes bacterium]|nr:PilT/PilU family type 4a pilus ATPase [Candidatus Hydrogenedentota bacterium]